MERRKRRSRRNNTEFKMDHNSIQTAVDKFLQKGGTIKKINSVQSSYKKFMTIKEPPTSIDDFLHGERIF